MKHIERTCHPLFKASEEIVEYVEIAVDVTEGKRAEQERERLRQLGIFSFRYARRGSRGLTLSGMDIDPI